MNQTVQKYLLEAGAYLKQAEQMGNDPRVADLCMACDGTLEAINVFIQDEEPWNLINEKNRELNKMFQEEFNKRIAKLKDKGAYYLFCQQKEIESDLLLWKCEQKVHFYDFLTKKYDV